jgi:hypothetical protein
MGIRVYVCLNVWGHIEIVWWSLFFMAVRELLFHYYYLSLNVQILECTYLGRNLCCLCSRDVVVLFQKYLNGIRFGARHHSYSESV